MTGPVLCFLWQPYRADSLLYFRLPQNARLPGGRVLCRWRACPGSAECPTAERIGTNVRVHAETRPAPNCNISLFALGAHSYNDPDITTNSPKDGFFRAMADDNKLAGLERKIKELSVFHEVGKALTSTLDISEVLQTIMEKISSFFRPDTWSLLMVDEDTKELYFEIAIGEGAEALRHVRLKKDEGIAGW